MIELGKGCPALLLVILGKDRQKVYLHIRDLQSSRKKFILQVLRNLRQPIFNLLLDDTPYFHWGSLDKLFFAHFQLS
eukprot:jgi/Pico_ML_1/54827/g689.t1